MDPTYPLGPVANLVAFILALLPLLTTDLLRKWNTGVCMFSVWIAVGCLTTAVSSIIWSDNINNIAPVWCDITTHLDVGSVFAMPACSLVITRRLYKITRIRDFSGTKKEKRMELIVDLSFTLGFPVLAMALFYIVQGARFQILEEVGCNPVIGAPGMFNVLVTGCSILLPVTSVLFYCPRILWILYHQRKEMRELLDSNSSMGRSTYYRIMILGCFDAILPLPIVILNLVLGGPHQFSPFWPGWTRVHTSFSVIPQYPTSVWESAGSWVVFSIKWVEWIGPFFALVFFVLFGLTETARTNYRRAFYTFLKPLGFKPSVKVKKRVSDIHFGSAPIGPAASGPCNSILPGVLSGSEYGSEADRAIPPADNIDIGEDYCIEGFTAGKEFKHELGEV